MFSHKEHRYLKDALELENFCILKFSLYADKLYNQEQRRLMFTTMKQKRRHAEEIKQILTEVLM